ncbi:MAG: hypothetical protein AB1567_05775 [bacterium]
MKRVLAFLLILSFFIWIGVILSLYFKVHYSYMALFLSKNNIFDELCLLFLLALLSYAFGRRILLLLRFKFHSLLEEFVFASGVGWVILAYGTMILNMLWRYACGLIVGILLLFAIELFVIVRNALPKIKSSLEVKFAPLSIILWYLLGVSLFLTLIMALSPPFEFGELAHLQSAHNYIESHKIPTSTIEMLFTLGILLNNDILAKLIHFYFGILVIINIFALVNRYFNPVSGLLSSCIFYINSLVIFLAGTARIELGLVFYELLAIYSFLCWVSSNKISWFVMMAIQVGFALAVDCHGIYCLIGLIPIIFYRKGLSSTIYLFSYIIIQLLIWCCLKGQILSILPLLAILMAHFIYSYLKEYTLLKRGIFCVITLIFILILSYESYVIINYYAPLKFIFGLENASEYVARNIVSVQPSGISNQLTTGK